MQLIMPGPGQYKLPDDTFGNKGKTLFYPLFKDKSGQTK